MSKIMCVKHGNEIDKTNFYIAGEGSIYEGVGRIPICKKCLEKIVNQYYTTYKDYKIALYYTLRKMDVGFDTGTFNGAIKQADTPFGILGRYMTIRNSLGDINNVEITFDDGEHPYSDLGSNKDDDNIDILLDMPVIRMTEEDYKIRDEVIELLGYEPFEGYSEADQKSLYSDLINYLDDEDVIEDQFLVSQIIQIVINNDQIRKLNFNINKYMSSPQTMLSHEGKIKNLSKMKNDIVSSTDKIARENGMTVKARGGGRGKKSSFTLMMQKLRDLDFEEAEVDYYDQKKAYGMQRAADVSMRALAEQIQFDENDINDIIIEQRKMIKEMEDKILDLEEENRLLLVKVAKYRNDEIAE